MDSAAGSLKYARDKRTQAVLPVFGKILNTMDVELNKVVKNTKIQDILKALRCGIGEEFDIEKLRYHKIIISADSDVDGSHIQLLYMTFFYKYLREIIDSGYLYIADPPLFRVKKGKKITYLYTAEELKEFDTRGATVNRFKGLGEMSIDSLEETLINRDTRKLIQVKLEDAEKAEEMLMITMGNDPALRRELLLEDGDLVV